MQETADSDHLLWPGEAAELLGVNRATLQRWAREGRIPVVLTPGGRRRYRRSDLLDLTKPKHVA
jgi:excisionase family DNA binding protein